MIKKLRENILEFIGNHEQGDNYHEFVRFIINNDDIDLYFCKLPSIVLGLFDVKTSKIKNIPFITATMKFSSIREFKEYYDNNKKRKYIIMYRILRRVIINDELNNQTYANLIRFIEIDKSKYKLINIKCELHAI